MMMEKNIEIRYFFLLTLDIFYHLFSLEWQLLYGEESLNGYIGILVLYPSSNTSKKLQLNRYIFIGR